MRHKPESGVECEIFKVMALIQKWSWKKAIISHVTHGDAWSYIDSFLTLGYWWRLWIVQELLFAPDIIMQYGDQTIPWGLLQNMLIQFQKSGSLKENWLVGNMLRGPPARICYQRLDRDIQVQNRSCFFH